DACQLFRKVIDNAVFARNPLWVSNLQIGGEGGIRAERDASRATPEDAPSRQRPNVSEGVGGEGGIRTHVPVTRQHAFEARPLRPLRYLSAMRAACTTRAVQAKGTFHYSLSARPGTRYRRSR